MLTVFAHILFKQVKIIIFRIEGLIRESNTSSKAIICNDFAFFECPVVAINLIHTFNSRIVIPMY